VTTRRRPSPDGYDEAGQPYSYLRQARHRGLEQAGAARHALYAGSRVDWHVRLASWALAAVPAALLLDPIWVLPAIGCVEVAWMVGLRWQSARERSRERVAVAEGERRRRQVYAAFGMTGDPEMLHGGEGPAWRVGDLVFKRAPGEQEWSWLGEHLPSVRGDGFRLAMPVPASDGRWVVDELCAQTWLAGTHPTTPRWGETLGMRTAPRGDATSSATPVPRSTHPCMGDR
jgi:hypothetical protein